MYRHIASNALSMLVVGLIALGVLAAWAQAQYSRAGPLVNAICLQVPDGGTMRTVSAQLLELGAISGGTIFRVGADYAGKAELLKAGSFRIPASSSMSEVVDIVTRGGANTCGTEIVFRIGVNTVSAEVRELDPETNRFEQRVRFNPGDDDTPDLYNQTREDGDTRFRIAMAEGATSWQIVEALKLADFIVVDLDDVPPEGSLAPDSYEVTVDTPLSALLQVMADAQIQRMAEAWPNRVSGLPIDSAEEAMILASIVEKETGLVEERRQVASVFINRLRRGIRLQTDPAVIYGLTGGQRALGRGLRQSELQRETPYNTYVIQGLPPTPIANPGLASIEAVLNPAITEYLFFVADGEGGHAFAETLAEHNVNVAAWRAIEASRSGQ